MTGTGAEPGASSTPERTPAPEVALTPEIYAEVSNWATVAALRNLVKK